MQTSQSNPNASADTERVASDEIARMLGERGIPVPGQVPVAANQPEASAASSGATNPFTSSELANIYREGRVATLVPTDEPNDVLQPLHPSTRIIMEYSHAISVEVAPFGSTESDAEAASRQRCIELDTRPGPNAFRKLAVVQSKKDLGVSIKAVSAEAAELLHCKLSFDPVADRIVIKNRNFKPVVAKLLAAAGGGDVPAQGGRPAELQPYLAEILEPGSWAILADSGQHILGLTILPRRNIAIVRTPDEAIGSAPQGTKREYEPSQPAGPDKKGKLKEGDPMGEASIVFQPAPEPSATPAIQDPGFSLVQHGLAAGVEGIVALGLRHPLEDLRAGDMAKILGPGGEDYTLTHDRTISLRSNSHVFTARHSNLPEKLMVVKVIRSPSGPVPPGASREVAGKLQQMAEMWLKEVRVHSRLSRHASVVRLHDHDARFLALYMENIDAPSLEQYPCNTLMATGVTRILSDISSALYYMHCNGFAHNDIKPANILFSPARGAVLIDFGLSTELSDERVHNGGTPWYVPPEFLDVGKRGAPGDVFALGVVMLYVLGKIPLPELHVPKLQWRIAEARIHQSEAQNTMDSWQTVVRKAADELDVASQLESMVKKMVSPKPGKRITLDSLVERLSELQ